MWIMSDRVLERMQELMDIKDREVIELRDEIAKRDRERVDRDWVWARHRVEDMSGLPLPRIELRLVSETSYRQDWELLLVNSEYGDEEYVVPLNASSTSGGSLARRSIQENLLETGVMTVDQFDFLPSIFTEFNRRHCEMGLASIFVVRDGGWLFKNMGDNNRVVKDTLTRLDWVNPSYVK